MAESRASCVDRGAGRRWTFAGRVFDELNWSLMVDGKRIPVESKPLELLRELLLRPGQVVSKGELLDRIWPDVTVVEASLPTAVAKLRRALDDDCHDQPIIETMSRIGYRLAVPVEIHCPEPGEPAHNGAAAGEIERGSGAPFAPRHRTRRAVARILLPVAATAVMLAAGARFLPSTSSEAVVPAPAPAIAARAAADRRDQLAALRRLDIGFFERQLAAGWDPNMNYDTDGNTALNLALEICEWEPDHDRHDLLYLARTLIDGGAKLEYRNVWGDTAYSIARAERYCGPNHAVTKMIRRSCFDGPNPLGDRCLADYRRDAAGKVIRQY